MEKKKISRLIESYMDTYIFALNSIHQLIADTSMGGSDLSLEQFFTLREIASNDTINAGDIAKKFAVTKSAIATKIKRLEEKNYIQRQKNPEDKREILLKITDSGHEIYIEYEQRMEEFVSKWVEALGEEDSEAFIALYKKLKESIIQVDQGSRCKEEDK